MNQTKVSLISTYETTASLVDSNANWILTKGLVPIDFQHFTHC